MKSAPTHKPGSSHAMLGLPICEQAAGAACQGPDGKPDWTGRAVPKPDGLPDRQPAVRTALSPDQVCVRPAHERLLALR